MPKNPDGPILATVVAIYPDGEHGPFVKAHSETPGVLKGMLTFSLNEPVWCELDSPNPGDHVVLNDIRSKNSTKGYRWQAHTARFHRPSDQSNANLKIKEGIVS